MKETAGGLTARVRGQVLWATEGRDRRFFLAIFLPAAALYLATTSWGVQVNVDVMTNSFTAWSIATSGSPVVQGYEVPDAYDNYLTWLRPTEDGHVASYPPGAALLASPLYAVAGRDLNTGTLYRDSTEFAELDPLPVSYPDLWPGSVTAAIASAAAIAFLGLTFKELSTGAVALTGAYVAAFGTSVWSVAADALWQQGPALLWVSLAVYLSHRQRWWWAGLAFGLAIFTRQLTAVVAAMTGISLAIHLRSLKPLVRIGAGSLVGAAAIALWNGIYLGLFTPWGTRSGQLASSVSLDGGFSGDVGTVGLLENQLRGAFDPINGFMILTPLFLVAAFFLVRAWKVAPPATRAAALGGLVYYLIQHRIQIYAHRGYDGYRYPLEALMASAPLWFLAYREALGWSRLVPPASAALSIVTHAIKAVRS